MNSIRGFRDWKNARDPGISGSRDYFPTYIRLLIITMTERIMYSEKHAEYIKQEKRTTTDTSNECQ